MINTLEFYNSIKANGVEFFTGVPDSLLKEFCFCIDENTAKSNHIINSNEGASIGLAIGYNLSTNKIPLVYFQNSGLGNIINPYTSLVHKSVFNIPALFFIGWRGEPGMKDEPQHFFQGKITKDLLNLLEINFEVLKLETNEAIHQLKSVIKKINSSSQPHAILVRKDTFSKYDYKKISNFSNLHREDCIDVILSKLNKKDIVISTTGKTSRELYELSSKNKNTNPKFYTIGGMGHTSQIALGLSNFSSRRVFCLDGDGSIIMHMGSLGIIGDNSSGSLCHVFFNNGTHESVGGQPSIGNKIDFKKLSISLGYSSYYAIDNLKKLSEFFEKIEDTFCGPCFVEIKIESYSRADLGRPKESPKEQKENFSKLYNL
jgi:phosphonopyruvate decarboxylase